MWNRRRPAVAILIVLAGLRGGAQSVYVDRLTLNTGPCTISSGNGAPTGGVQCDTYLDTATGEVYTRRNGGAWTLLIRAEDTNTFTANQTFNGSVTIGGALLLSTPLPVGSGGTGRASWTPGDLVVAAGATSLVGLPAVATGQVLTSTGTGSQPAFSGNPRLASIGATNWASRTAGWIVDAGGNAETQTFWSREMHVTSFVTDYERAIDGLEIVTPGVAVLSEDFTVPPLGASSGNFRVEYRPRSTAPLFSVGDTVVIHTYSRGGGALTVSDAIGTVSGPDTTNPTYQQWTFTRGSGVNTGGTMAGAAIVPAKTIVLDYGVSGQGFVETNATAPTQLVSMTSAGTTATATTNTPHGFLTGDTVVISGASQPPYNGAFVVTVTGASTFTYTLSGATSTPAVCVNGCAAVGAYGVNTPYVQVSTWAGSPTYGVTPRTRWGNLRGLTGVGEYGILAGDFTGRHYVRISDQNAEIAGLPLDLYDGATKTISLSPTAPSLAIGNPIPTGFGTGANGLWAGRDSDGTYKFRLGTPGGTRVAWDGVALTLAGEGSGVTNINGGNIQANSITVGSLQATGFGDNMIKNAAFEGRTATEGLAGWSQDDTAGGSASIVWTTLGTEGPMMAGIATVAGGFNSLIYYAIPVAAGQTYRIAFDVNGQTSAGLYVRLNESTSTQGYVRYVREAAASGSDVAYTSITDVCGNCSVASTGWNHREFTYTVPANVHWLSIDLYNYTCRASGATCQTLYFDDVEMQIQIGSGHIRAASLTGDRLVANTITAGQIQAGTITTTEIAANTILAANIAGGTITGAKIAAGTITGGNIAGTTITAGNLAAGTITSAQIAAGTITGGNIAGATITGGNLAAGTVTAGNIAAGTITADKLSVATLSAITANLGTITAGNLSAVGITSSTITSSTLTAGCATLNTSGISLSGPTGGQCNWYKWNGSSIGLQWDGGAWMTLSGANVQISSAGSNVNVAGNVQFFAQDQIQIQSNSYGGAFNITNGQTHIGAAGNSQTLDLNSDGSTRFSGTYIYMPNMYATPGGNHVCIGSTDGLLYKCA